MIVDFFGKKPSIHKSCFIAPTATIIGDVKIGAKSSVWPGAVIRGDRGSIRIGKCSSIQDNAIIHAQENRRTLIGDHVTIGHGAIVHGASIQNCALIGMSATVLDEVSVGSYCMVGAGSVVTKDIPPKSLVVGVPAKVVRGLKPEDMAHIRKNALDYVKLGQNHIGNPGWKKV